jgi:hypothetical protein
MMLLKNASVGICTLGVGEPSKMSKEEFLKIDKQCLDFARICKKTGSTFLSSVGCKPLRPIFLKQRRLVAN